MSSDRDRVLDYDRCLEEKIAFLDENRQVILATSLDDRVTARTIDYANDGMNIYFLSWDHHTKISQIKGNLRVALCRDNVQIEGVAQILGDPLHKRNEDYSNVYKQRLPDLYEIFSGIPGMTLVRIMPILFSTFYGGRDRRIEYVDIIDRRAYWKKLEEM
jgi:uncharacterized pyridoxamine 5'-phosphate oxidase family protein